MQLELDINMNGAAFQDEGWTIEASSIFHRLATHIIPSLQEGDERLIIDSNGNSVGTIRIKKG